MINKIFVSGRLTADPKMAYFESTNKCVAEFSLAINRPMNKDTIYIDCKAWNKRGETLAKCLRKGDKIAICGDLDEDRWTSREGKPQRRHYINIMDFEFLSVKGPHSPQGAPSPKTSTGDSTECSEDAIPF